MSSRAKLLGRWQAWMAIVLIWLILLPFGLYRLYASDEVQYFAYLRSLVKDGDLDFANEYAYFAEQGRQNDDLAVYNALLRDHPTDPPRNPQTGLYRNVAPIGSAILWSPWYLGADLLVSTGIIDAPADGYSRPYIVAVCLASASYTLIGLLLTYRIARRWASPWAASTATITTWLASPLIWYTYIQMPWSHGTSFAMVALFLTLWLGPDDAATFAERASRRSLGRWMLLGALGGLMTLTREQLGLFLLLPAVESLAAYWAMLRARSWGAAAALLGRHALFLGCLALALLPQLLVYQTLYGQPRPAGTVSGKLQLVSEHFFHTLFDLRRGAFLWAPVWLAGLAGLALLWRRNWRMAALLLLAFVAQTYINGAFGTTWHLRGSFGFRRLIECIPVFVVGLALVVDRIRPRALVVGLAVALIAWNGGLVVQATVTNPVIRGDGLVWDSMLSEQLAAPARALRTLDQLLFNRCDLIKNCEETP